MSRLLANDRLISLSLVFLQFLEILGRRLILQFLKQKHFLSERGVKTSRYDLAFGNELHELWVRILLLLNSIYLLKSFKHFLKRVLPRKHLVYLAYKLLLLSLNKLLFSAIPFFTLQQAFLLLQNCPFLSSLLTLKALDLLLVARYRVLNHICMSNWSLKSEFPRLVKLVLILLISDN